MNVYIFTKIFTIIIISTGTHRPEQAVQTQTAASDQGLHGLPLIPLLLDTSTDKKNVLFWGRVCVLRPFQEYFTYIKLATRL